MKNCNCKETTTTQCKPDPCDFVYKQPVDECTNKTVYYITQASAVLMDCNGETTVKSELDKLQAALQRINDRLDEQDYEGIRELFETLFGDWKDHLNDLLDQLTGNLITREEFNNTLKNYVKEIVVNGKSYTPDENGVVNLGTISGGSSLGQIQSNWAQDDNTKVDYIKNKPSDTVIFATSDFNISDKAVRTNPYIKFKFQPLDLNDNGIWDVDDRSCLYVLYNSSLEYKNLIETRYKDFFNKSGDGSSDEVKIVNEMIYWISERKEYPVQIVPLYNETSNAQIPRINIGDIKSGVYYDFHLDKFFNITVRLDSDNNPHFYAKYIVNKPLFSKQSGEYIIRVYNQDEDDPSILKESLEYSYYDQFTNLSSVSFRLTGSTLGRIIMIDGQPNILSNGFPQVETNQVTVNLTQHGDIYTGTFRAYWTENNYTSLSIFSNRDSNTDQTGTDDDNNEILSSFKCEFYPPGTYQTGTDDDGNHKYYKACVIKIQTT